MSILYTHIFCAFEQKSFQKHNACFVLTQLNGLLCFEGMRSDPSNCCQLIPCEGAPVGSEELQALACFPLCLLTEMQRQVWGCRPGGNLMRPLPSKSNVLQAEAVFPHNAQHFFFFLPAPRGLWYPSSLTRD